jgi:glucose-6-phosphate isomerase
MNITKNIFFKNFNNKENFKLNNYLNNLRKNLKKLIENKENNQIINSLGKKYQYSYSKKFIHELIKSNLTIRIIGIGGSILGTMAIFSFLKKKISKNIVFIDNLNAQRKKESKKKYLNIIVSKSGNTLETLVNFNYLIKKKDKNLFITEKKDSFLKKIALKMKSKIIEHNNFIGGRYSVLSEVGMLPASLAGLNEKKFKQFNDLVKNKFFLNQLILNCANIYSFLKEKKFNSIIINYDEMSQDFFYWYQQLVAESLGKKEKGIMPIISLMPKDNHSLLQLYLDGPKNNFFTFFSVDSKKQLRIKENNYFKFDNYLKNKTFNEILNAQRKASENIFQKKNIPLRSFQINNRNENSLGELFTFFILETILLSDLMEVNAFNQPAVELIKDETKSILKRI